MKVRFAGWFASPRLLVAALLLVPSVALGQDSPPPPPGPPAPGESFEADDRDNRGPREQSDRRDDRSDGDRERDREPGADRRERPRPVLDTLFRRLDASQDGDLESAEIPEDRKQLFRRLVAQADDNGDRKLSREEFDAGMAQLAERFSNRFRMAFRGPGDRTQRDRAPRDERPGGPAAGLFGALDRDADGRISDEEMASATRSLKRLDHDGNGLTPNEIGPGGPPRRVRPASDRDDPNRREGDRGGGDERRGGRDGDRPGPDGPPAFGPGGPGNPGGPGGRGGFWPNGPELGGPGGPQGNFRGGLSGGFGLPGFRPRQPRGGPSGFGGDGLPPGDPDGIPPAIRELFDRVDRNHDGQVGREELREFFRALEHRERRDGGRPPGPDGPRTGGRPGAVEV